MPETLTPVAEPLSIDPTTPEVTTDELAPSLEAPILDFEEESPAAPAAETVSVDAVDAPPESSEVNSPERLKKIARVSKKIGKYALAGLVGGAPLVGYMAYREFSSKKESPAAAPRTVAGRFLGMLDVKVDSAIDKKDIKKSEWYHTPRANRLEKKATRAKKVKRTERLDKKASKHRAKIKKAPSDQPLNEV